MNYKFVEDGPQGTIKVALKYDSVNKVNAIKKLIRVSTPGMRKYTGYKDMPRVINGLGIAIISTSKGVMTDKEASDLKIGGEVQPDSSLLSVPLQKPHSHHSQIL